MRNMNSIELMTNFSTNSRFIFKCGLWDKFPVTILAMLARHEEEREEEQDCEDVSFQFVRW